MARGKKVNKRQPQVLLIGTGDDDSETRVEEITHSLYLSYLLQ